MQPALSDTFPMPNKKEKKDQPVHEVRIKAIKAAIWENQTESGIRHNVTVSRLYKDGDAWKSADSFGRDDLLVLAKVLDHAHTWICSQKQEEGNSSQRPQEEA